MRTSFSGRPIKNASPFACGKLRPTRGLRIGAVMPSGQPTSAFRSALESAYRQRQVTRLHVHIGYVLSGWRTGIPKHRQIAFAAGCCVRSVVRALARLHALGLLSWTRRVVACRGWRAQTANSYALLSPKPLSVSVIQSSASLSPSAAGTLAVIAATRAASLAAAWSARRTRHPG